MQTKSLPYVFVFLFFGVFLQRSVAQPKFQYLSPLPNSSLVSSNTNIIIRHGEILDRASVEMSSAIEVNGDKSSNHSGRIKLTSDEKTIVFVPDVPFSLGEKVSVTLTPSVKTLSGIPVGPLSFSFTISNSTHIRDTRSVDKLMSEMEGIPSAGQRVSNIMNSSSEIRMQQSQFLPPDFPAIAVLNSIAPSPGFIFTSNFTWVSGVSNTPYLLILNNKGEPTFYRKMPAWCLDFKMQPMGILTYYDGSLGYFVAMDSTYNVVDTFRIGNGYSTDVHELRVLPNRHALLMSYDYEAVQMDTVVAGGNPAAVVIGLIIQEIDENKDVVFQWRSWDHFKITDATHENLIASYIDYVHGNAIEIDYDGNLLISSRHMDEITKINRQTGEIMWRLGGKNNQFTFVNDPIGFFYQHAIRRLPNGNITLFDNGNFHDPRFSRAVEYRLDENNKTATLVWQYRNSPDNYGFAMGYQQRLSNNNNIIGWGTGNPSVTEVTTDGSKVFELALPSNVFSYRAYRFPWRDGILRVDADTLRFGNVAVSDSLITKLTVRNLTQQSRTITGVITRDARYEVLTPLPINIAPADTATISVMFKPDSWGTFADVLDIRSESSSEGIIEQVALMGESTPPTISTSVVELDFGIVDMDSSLSRNLRITNSGGNPLLIDSIYSRNGFFTVSQSRIVVKDSVTVTVTFHPVSSGSFTDVLYLKNNSATPLVRVVLFGSSPSPANISISHVEIDFGVVAIDSIVTRIVKIANTGASPLVIDSIYTGTGRFRVNKSSGNVLSDTLNINVSFHPDTFAVYSDSLYLRNNSKAGLVKIPLRGESPLPVLTIAPLTYRKDTVAIGDSTIQKFFIKNSSINDLTLQGMSTKTSIFYALGFTSGTVKSQDSTSFSMIFKPTSFSEYADTLVVNSIGGINKYPLTGFSPYPQMTISTTAFDYGSVFKDSTAKKAIVVKNSSINKLRIDSLKTRIKQFITDTLNSPIFVSEIDSVVFLVSFNPDTIRSYDDTLLIYTNEQKGLVTIPLTGKGNPVTSVAFNDDLLPKQYELNQNYPNPFNPSTTLRYALPANSNVRLTIFNTLGQRVVELVNQQQNAGWHRVQWDANISSGMYFYRIEATDVNNPNNRFVETKKMLLLR